MGRRQRRAEEGRVAAGTVSLSAKRVPREVQRGREYVIRCTLDVGPYTDSFPVTAAEGLAREFTVWLFTAKAAGPILGG